MVREAEAHAETDKVNRERVEAINQAEVGIFVNFYVTTIYFY